MWNKASTNKLQKYNKVQNTKLNKNPELTGLKWSGTALADIKRLLSEENGTWSQVGYLHMLQQIEPISLHAEKCTNCGSLVAWQPGYEKMERE